MAIDPISWGMLLTTGFGAWQQYEAGRAAEAAYKAEAAEIGQQTAYEQRMALEEMKEISREGRSAESQAVAAAGKSGLRVAGSVVTLTQAIQSQVARRKALIGFQFGERARRAHFEMGQLRYAGKRARKTGQIRAYGSLLTGGMDLAWRKEQKGYKGNKGWFELFFPKR